MDNHVNFAYSTVLTPPSPGTTGATVVVQSGDGAKFPTPPFNAVVCPVGVLPLGSNAEVVRVTARPGAADTFTITRAQEGSTARSVIVGDQFFAGITAKSVTDIENVLNGSAYRAAVLQDSPVSFWRLGERRGVTTAFDEQNANPGSYTNALVNAVGNPGFETDTSGWSTSVNFNDPSATLTRVTTQSHSGVASLQVVTTAAVGEGAEYALAGTFLAGVTYTASMWLKGNAGGEIYAIQLGIGTDYGYTTATLTTSWQQVSCTWTPTANRTTASLDVQHGVASVATFFVDDAVVTGSAGVVLEQPGGLVNDPNPGATFDGRGGYVSVPDAAALRLVGDMTLEAWVKPNASGVSYDLITKGVGEFPGPYLFRLNPSGAPSFYRGNGTLNAAVNATNAPPVGVWSHIAVTMLGTTATHYLNGQPNGSGTLSTTIADQGSILGIGAAPGGYGFSNVSLDEISIYAGALSAARILAHYNAGRPSWNRGVRVLKSAVTSLGNATAIAVPFDVETYKDEVAQHSNTTNNTRLTCVTAGRYEMFGALAFATSATGARGAAIRLNGTTYLASQDAAPSPTVGETTTVSVGAVYTLAAGDYVELMGYQVSGGALNVATADSMFGSPSYFGMERISG